MRVSAYPRTTTWARQLTCVVLAGVVLAMSLFTSDRLEAKDEPVDTAAAVDRTLRALTALWTARIGEFVGDPDTLPDLDDLARSREIRALERAGKAALPDLMKLLQSTVPSQQVYQAAKDGLRAADRRAIGRGELPMAGLYESGMKEEAAYLTDLAHALAARILARLGPDAAQAVPILAKGLPAPYRFYSESDESESTHGFFARVQALGAIGKSAAAAAPTLIHSLKSSNGIYKPRRTAVSKWRLDLASRAQTALIDALAKMGEAPLHQASPEIVRVLMYGNDEAAQEAGQALVMLRHGALEQFKEPLASKNWKVKRAVQLGVDRYAGALMSWLRSNPSKPNAWVRHCFEQMINPMFDVLAREVRSGYREYDYRALLAEVLGSAQKKSKKSRAVTVLAKLLSNRNIIVRAGALRGLSRLGPAAKRSVAALIPLLDSKTGTERRLAAEALGAIGPEARDALDALGAHVEDGDKAASAVFREAIRKISGIQSKEAEAKR